MNMKTTVLFILITAFPIILFGQETTTNENVTTGQLIQTIIAKTEAKIVPNTVDVIKEGMKPLEE